MISRCLKHNDRCDITYRVPEQEFEDSTEPHEHTTIEDHIGTGDSLLVFLLMAIVG